MLHLRDTTYATLGKVGRTNTTLHQELADLLLSQRLNYALPSAGYVISSYAYNGNMTDYKHNTGVANGRNIAALSATAKTILTFEVKGNQVNPVANEHDSAGGNFTYGGDYVARVRGTDTGNGILAVTDVLQMSGSNASLAMTNLISKPARHLEMSNFLFADGHVKSLKGAAVSVGSPNSSADNAAGDCTINGFSYQACAAGTNVDGYAGTFSIQ